MNGFEEVLQRLQGANPVPDPDLLPEEELVAVRSLLAERRAGVTRREKGTAPAWRRPALVFGAAFVFTTLVIGVAAVLLLGRDETPVGEDTQLSTTTLQAPTTSTTDTPTTTQTPTTAAPTSTTTEVIPPGPMTWTRVQIGDQGSVNAVVEGGPGLIAVGESDGDAAVWTSSDGATWERIPHDETVFGGDGSYSISDVAAGPDGYVAVGGGRIVVGSGPREPVVWASADGLVWQRIPLDEAAFGVAGFVSLNAVAYGPAGFVAVGWESPLGEPWLLDGHYVIQSADGITWRRADLGDLALGGMWDLAARGPGYVAVGVDWSGAGRAGAWTSDDGLAWSLSDPSGVEFAGAEGDIENMTAVAVAGDGRLIATGNGAQVWTSDDGLLWPRLGSHDPAPPVAGLGRAANALVISGDRIVAVGALEFGGGAGSDQAAVWASGDGGVTWHAISAPGEVFGGESGAMAMNDVVDVGGTYVAVGFWDGEATVWLGSWNEEDGS